MSEVANEDSVTLRWIEQSVPSPAPPPRQQQQAQAAPSPSSYEVENAAPRSVSPLVVTPDTTPQQTAVPATHHANTAGLSLLNLYKGFCQEANCRPNSAVLALLKQQDPPNRPLLTLCIPHSYLGPKGLLPVLRLVVHCQTLEVLDLRGNGVDNEGAGQMCDMLQNHLGLSKIYLDGNAITNDGGRRLMQLAERNTRIIVLSLEDTDVYESLRERLQQTLAKRGGGQSIVQSAAERRSPIGAAEVAGDEDAPAPVHRVATSRSPPPGAALTPLTLVPSKPPASAPPTNQRSTSRASNNSAHYQHSSQQQQPSHQKSPSVALTSAPRATSSSSAHQHPSAEESRLSQQRGGGSCCKAVMLDAPGPRPPAPAVASRDFASRLTDQQRTELLQKYEARAKTFEAVATSEASRAADRTRLELMRVEQHRARSPEAGVADPIRRLSRPNSAAPVAENASSTFVPHLAPRNGSPEDNVTSTIPAPMLAPSNTACFFPDTAAGARSASPTKASKIQSNNNNNLGGTASRKSTAASSMGNNKAWSVGELPIGNQNSMDPLSPRNGRDDSSVGGPPTVNMTIDNSIDDPQQPPSMNHSSTGGLTLIPLTLTKEEQFKQLFSRGCSLYNERKLDAAYLSWNEALELAVTERNREWMAVVSSNLQRLSYELLVAEGAKHLETFNLEDADKTFQLALDVALKSKNAAWEAEMIRAKRNVQHAVFQRSHESALLLFEKAKSVRESPVTADDRFAPSQGAHDVDPKDLQTHTASFVAEWARLLYVKEAVEMWADAAMVARRISGTATKQLLDTVNAAVSNVAALLTRKYLVPEYSTDKLPMQGVSRFTYSECTQLIGLWTDLISKSQTTLGNRTWDATAAAELGHLYLATHQLPLALQCFERVIDFGTAVQSTLLMACGHTYVGLVHWQRSNYAVAERSFGSAMEYWKGLRVRGVGNVRGAVHETEQDDYIPLADPTKLLHNQSVVDTQNASTNNSPSSAVAVRSGGSTAAADYTAVALDGFITMDYVNAMMSRCYHHLVGLLVATHRYREALETLEQSLLHQYHDRLHDKLLRNFTPKPTLDHISAVAVSVDSPLLYYEVAYRFEWIPNREMYETTQQLFTWVVPKAGDIKVVTMNVSHELGVASIETLLGELRTALCVDPLHRVSVQPQIHETLPENAWMPALKALYKAFIYPISDFLRVQDSEATTRLGTLTIIPSKLLWTVPFNALLNYNSNRYLIEEYSLQLSFSAVHLAFSVLSARRVQERGLTKRAVVVQPETDLVHHTAASTTAHQGLDVTFPFDAPRSLKEGKRVAESLAAAAPTSSRRRRSEQTQQQQTNTATTSEQVGESTLQDKAETRELDHVVENYDVLMELLPKLRFLHLAVATTSQAGPIDGLLLGKKDDGSTGGFYVATEGLEELRFIRSGDLSQRDLFTELVVLSYTNMSVEKTRGTRDGILNLIRAFLCSGSASVIAGIWCTPEMAPSELFEQLYQCILTKERHKAKAMALAVRHLLQDDRMRFAPRLWSGYFVVGCPIV